MADEEGRAKQTKTSKTTEKVYPAQIYAEDMSEEWSKDAVKVAR